MMQERRRHSLAGPVNAAPRAQKGMSETYQAECHDRTGIDGSSVPF